MKARLVTLAAAAALAITSLLAGPATPALAGPPGFFSLGLYPTLDACHQAGKEKAVIFGPVYICEAHQIPGYGTWYELWMH
ncbi:hypothetical protein Skr01_24100 [Sphaerisporangium krabiense]|uniref:DUF333 domain-containing protein n=1 Tax=Sphaerisporangium krabiense TaxID=763782 RepID=A0A7W8Z619_9ACTN|nr:hypothetical protein [Sphaerisporangium krabiense]MBB5628156.1 hypothetical protein [Sphaerisporangium krabiense]GII62325.1 hypothetical protein Skr01_24100 [Sphaerisporangium krabiense]